jgi:hypothetical protein
MLFCPTPAALQQQTRTTTTLEGSKRWSEMYGLLHRLIGPCPITRPLTRLTRRYSRVNAHSSNCDVVVTGAEVHRDGENHILGPKRWTTSELHVHVL